jgi:flavin reductase (DIM6/NTAB) family NADH-FMN oxidoreductase RutF
MKIDLANLDTRDTRHVMAGAVVPRPIAWVSTVDEDGIFNLAPFSAYCMVSLKPAMVGFCIGVRNRRKKDTLINIESTKEFVINVVDETLAEPMNVTSTPYPSDVDEFKEAGLTPVKADLVKAPMVAESPINLECRLNQILEFGEAPLTNRFIIGEVLRVHIRDELYVDGDIQLSKLKAIGRFGGGGDLYCRTSDIFEMKYPTGGI